MIFLAHQMQTFLMHGDVQLPKSYTYTFRLNKGPKLSISGRKMQIFFIGKAGMQPPKTN